MHVGANCGRGGGGGSGVWGGRRVVSVKVSVKVRGEAEDEGGV